MLYFYDYTDINLYGLNINQKSKTSKNSAYLKFRIPITPH